MSEFTKKEKLLDLIGKIKTFICDDEDFDDDDWKDLEQIEEAIELFHSPLGHMTKYNPKEEWIRIK